jgi:hypothetical protein
MADDNASTNTGAAGDAARGNQSDGNESDKPVLPCSSQYVNYDNYGEARPGHLHAGEDFACPAGTEMIACEDGVVHSSPLGGSSGYGIHIDLDVGKYTLRYAHLQKITQTGNVKRGDVIGLANNTGSSFGDHLHFEVRTDGPGGSGFEGTIPPKDYLTGAVDPGGGAAGSTSGGGGAGSFSEEDLFAIGRAASMSSMLQLPGMMNLGESIMMRGAKSIYNDEPLLPFVQQLCESSLRHFQSLPNGAFYAFFPDHFGFYGHRKAYWEIDDIEIVDGGIDLTDESLATHVFVVGDTNLDGGTDLADRVASKGVVTIFDAFASDDMIQKPPAPDEGKKSRQKKDQDGKKKDEDAQKDNMQARLHALEFLRKYGVRPHYEEATFIRNGFFELFYAYTQFQYLWANQFRTQFSFTFMPELYPGGRVRFKDHGFECYIDSVTHTFDYESGFVTQANRSWSTRRWSHPSSCNRDRTILSLAS